MPTIFRQKRTTANSLNSPTKEFEWQKKMRENSGNTDTIQNKVKAQMSLGRAGSTRAKQGAIPFNAFSYQQKHAAAVVQAEKERQAAIAKDRAAATANGGTFIEPTVPTKDKDNQEDTDTSYRYEDPEHTGRILTKDKITGVKSVETWEPTTAKRAPIQKNVVAGANAARQGDEVPLKSREEAMAPLRESAARMKTTNLNANTDTLKAMQVAPMTFGNNHLGEYSSKVAIDAFGANKYVTSPLKKLAESQKKTSVESKYGKNMEKAVKFNPATGKIEGSSATDADIKPLVDRLAIKNPDGSFREDPKVMQEIRDTVKSKLTQEEEPPNQFMQRLKEQEQATANAARQAAVQKQKEVDYHIQMSNAAKFEEPKSFNELKAEAAKDPLNPATMAYNQGVAKIDEELNKQEAQNNQNQLAALNEIGVNETTRGVMADEIRKANALSKETQRTEKIKELEQTKDNAHTATAVAATKAQDTEREKLKKEKKMTTGEKEKLAQEEELTNGINNIIAEFAARGESMTRYRAKKMFEDRENYDMKSEEKADKRKEFDSYFDRLIPEGGTDEVDDGTIDKLVMKASSLNGKDLEETLKLLKTKGFDDLTLDAATDRYRINTLRIPEDVVREGRQEKDFGNRFNEVIGRLRSNPEDVGSRELSDLKRQAEILVESNNSKVNKRNLAIINATMQNPNMTHEQVLNLVDKATAAIGVKKETPTTLKARLIMEKFNEYKKDMSEADALKQATIEMSTAQKKDPSFWVELTDKVRKEKFDERKAAGDDDEAARRAAAQAVSSAAAKNPGMASILKNAAGNAALEKYKKDNPNATAEGEWKAWADGTRASVAQEDVVTNAYLEELDNELAKQTNPADRARVYKRALANGILPGSFPLGDTAREKLMKAVIKRENKTLSELTTSPTTATPPKAEVKKSIWEGVFGGEPEGETIQLEEPPADEGESETVDEIVEKLNSGEYTIETLTPTQRRTMEE